MNIIQLKLLSFCEQNIYNITYTNALNRKVMDNFRKWNVAPMDRPLERRT